MTRFLVDGSQKKNTSALRFMWRGFRADVDLGLRCFLLWTTPPTSAALLEFVNCFWCSSFRVEELGGLYVTTFRYHAHVSFYFFLLFVCLACLLQIMHDNWILCFFLLLSVLELGCVFFIVMWTCLLFDCFFWAWLLRETTLFERTTNTVEGN
jgi:hypothetical protein